MGFDYTGDCVHRATVEAALHRVVDPELAVDILELGLVYGVEVAPEGARVRLTMTSPACPVGEWIADEVVEQLGQALGTPVAVDIVWEPAWTPERMSEQARRALDG